MEEIAQKLGVSKTTVHYALRNKGRVSDATRQRVLEIAAQLGYRPNLVARSLRAQNTDTLGVVVTSLTSSFHAHVLEGIESIAQQHKHTILLSCSYGIPQKERDLVEVLLEKAVDGLIIAPADPEENCTYYKRLMDEGIHLVFVDRQVPGVNVDMVSTDNIMGGYLAAQHLVKLGRKKIVFVTTTSRSRRSTSVQGRLLGCNRALQEAGLEPATVIGPGELDTISEEQFAYNSMLHFLASGKNQFDGVFATHDGLAYGAIEALIESGKRVPEDVSVVGFDDQDPSAYYHPPLTTIRQPMREIGNEAARLLFRRFKEAETSLPRQQVSLEPNLIVRRSCGMAQK